CQDAGQPALNERVVACSARKFGRFVVYAAAAARASEMMAESVVAFDSWESMATGTPPTGSDGGRAASDLGTLPSLVSAGAAGSVAITVRVLGRSLASGARASSIGLSAALRSPSVPLRRSTTRTAVSGSSGFT